MAARLSKLRWRKHQVVLAGLAVILVCLASVPARVADTANPASQPATFVTAHDTIPNFAYTPSITSVQNGAWSDPLTWNLARVPNATDIALVAHEVSYDSLTGIAAVIGVDTGGALRFLTTQNTRLQVGTLLVMPGGAFEIGTEQQPLGTSFTAELILRNLPLNSGSDPDQYGTGLLSIDGRIDLHGAPKNPTFVRLAAAPPAGATTFALEQAVTGWHVGDKLVLPESAQQRTETSGVPDTVNSELVTIQSISADSLTITFTPALAFAHPPARDGNGQITFYPHVGNITRNIVIRSESRSGTRGHVLLTRRSDIDIRYSAFQDLGRTTIDPLNPATNHIGRYSLHIHHVSGPATPPSNGYQFTLVGNSVYENSSSVPRQKWGVTLHDSHYGLIKDNVVYNLGGAGFVAEDGSESYNVIERNFAVKIAGEGSRLEDDASEGVGFWFRGPNNYIRDNVAANMVELSGPEAAYGFKFNFVYLGNIRIPIFPGADTSVPGQYVTVAGNAMPLLEFAGNETYSVIQGLTIWWLCTLDFEPMPNCPRSTVQDMRMWHVSRYSYYGYPASGLTFDGLVIRGDSAIAASGCCEFGGLFWFGDYMNKDVIVRNSDVQGIKQFVLPYFGDGTTTVSDSFFRVKEGITNLISGAPGSCPGCDLPERTQIIRNVQFAALPGRSLRSITMGYTTHNGSADLANRDEVFVYDYQGIAGDHFQVYYNEQATQNIAGGLAPCTDTTTHPEIDGITCPELILDRFVYFPLIHR